jgi:ABC-type branched-subunit amino acid transport system ATPase component
VAMELAQRIYIVDQGRVRLCTTPEGLQQDPQLVQAFLGVSGA